MCGRFTLTLDPADLQDAFPEFSYPSRYNPRYNISPTQPVLAIPNDGKGQAGFFRWGLIPSWAKDTSIGNRLINARAETLAEKPAFRAAYRYRRCLILTDGFYEWHAPTGQKTKLPYYIHMINGSPFAFAGLWEEWCSPDGSPIKSCTIVTTSANETIAPLHHRMPVIVHTESFTQWLDPSPCQPTSLQKILAPYPAEELVAQRVSTLVNNPNNDLPECVKPMA